MTSSRRKNTKKRQKIKTGTVEAFFSDVGSAMRAADKKEKIKPRPKTITFEDPLEMLHILSIVKLKLINRIRKKPDSITNLAKATHRRISAVSRDVHELEEVGIVKIHSIVNPGHGRHKLIELTASSLKLEVSI